MPTPQLRIRPDPSPLRAQLDTIRREVGVPDAFPAAVEAEAELVVARGPQLPPGAADGAVGDRTDLALVTVDPEGSRDLDQAFLAERRDGGGYRVFYAIADVGAFVTPGGALDTESRLRVQTLYQPDRRTPLYPEALGQGAASLLPDEVRQAVLWTIDLDAEGRPTGRPTVERARVRSRRQLTYAGVQADLDAGTADEPLVLLREIGQLREQRETERGGVSLRIPAQEVDIEADGVTLRYEASFPVEGWNAQISLLTGIAAATMMLDGGIGILRTLPPPEAEAVEELRRRAEALAVAWPTDLSYPAFVRDLDPAVPTGAALLIAAARTLGGAGYTVFDGEPPAEPGHAAVASTYAHVTAPLRRLADRFANEILLALAGGYPVPDWARSALADLPELMIAGRRREREIERAVIDLAEAILLAPRVGETFAATVVTTDGRGQATIQLRDPAVVAPLDDRDVTPGTEIRVILRAADPVTRVVQFVPAPPA